MIADVDRTDQLSFKSFEEWKEWVTGRLFARVDQVWWNVYAAIVAEHIMYYYRESGDDCGRTPVDDFQARFYNPGFQWIEFDISDVTITDDAVLKAINPVHRFNSWVRAEGVAHG